MRRKILALTLCVAMLAIAIVGGSLAYFTDENAQTNAFTAGKVDISLDEAIVAKDVDPKSATYGDLIATSGRTEDDQEYHLYPAMNVTKDPTITVADDSEDAFIAAIITVTGNIHDLIGVPGYDNIDIHQIVKGGLVTTDADQVTGWNGLSMVYETDACVIYQAADKAKNTWTMYIFVKDAQVAGSKIVLFDTLEINEKWDNEEMEKINGMEINVKAYATQANGFVDCYTAMTTAFDADFAAVK